MEKIVDYLRWRGDLSFTRDPINEIDLLVFSLLSYLPFGSIVPGPESDNDISLKDASAQYIQKLKNNEILSKFKPTASTSMDSELVQLLEQAANCHRFEKIRLSNYDECTDFVIGTQFGAITFSLVFPENGKIVAFRGTDNSVIGWKEDFQLAYAEQTPAQEAAARYLERSIGIFSGRVFVCGHSKGGNLAIYAGSRQNLLRQNKISKILNFDGPGFDFSIVERSSFSECENKITNFIPEESIVGMLLEPVGKRVVVASSSRLINQHNALSWGVNRTKFLKGKLSSSAKLLEKTLHTWLKEISVSDREQFLEAFFEILGASEGAAIKLDPQDNLLEIRKLLLKYYKLDSKTKSLLTQVFLSLTSQSRKTLATTLREKLPKKNWLP